MSNVKTNRNKCVQWGITFPHSGNMSDSVFHEYFPPSVYSICVKEHHANGEPHLHMGLKLKKPISYSNFLKYITKKFPDDYKRIDVQQIKNWQDWDDYLNKEAVPFVRGERTKKKPLWRRLVNYSRNTLISGLRWIIFLQLRFLRRVSDFTESD